MAASFDAEDLAFFRARMGKVRPSRASARVATKASAEPTCSDALRERQLAAQQAVESKPAPQVDANSVLRWQQPQLGASHLAGLSSGRGIDQQAQLDLHGLNVEQARRRVSLFIKRCQSLGHRRALIVHGKGLHSEDGLPRLKSELTTWLRAEPKVLAYCSALPADGGTGALYVSLAS